MPGTHRRTTTQRGLGHRHRQQVDGLKRVMPTGSPCWWCGRPMFTDAALNWDGKSLQGDHSIPRSVGGAVADRLLHATCNNQRGDGSRDHLRPAISGANITDLDECPNITAHGSTTSDLGRRLLPWP
jgi:hypothetical protein